MLKEFNEWYGGPGCEGHPPVGYGTNREAETTMHNVIEEMRRVRGIRTVRVCIEDRFNNGRYWVHNTSTYDPDAPRRWPY